jgi:hypothetical protein
MDDTETRLRVRLERLAAAVPVRSPQEVVVERVRPSAALVRPPSATLLVAALLVAVVAVGVGLASRLAAPASPDGPSAIAPASHPTGSTSPVPSPSNAGASLVISTTVEEPCPPTEGGRCHYAAVLNGLRGKQWEWDLIADGSAGRPSALAPGTYTLRLEARYGSDIIVNGSPAPAGTNAVCSTSFKVTPTTTSVPVTATFTLGLCTVVVSGTPAPATSATPLPVVVSLNAPLEPTDCGWPPTTPLAFAAYATVGDLDAGQIIQGSPNEHVYALVTRDPVELHPMIGSPMLERGLCALRQDGSRTESAVGADWTFNGTQQNPVVTCEGTATSCVRETLVVLDAVASVGHPAMRITFRSDEMCIGAPFGGRPCAAPAWPDGTQRMTSAVATFSGIEQQAFLSLFWLADGSISAGYMTLEAPPPGATPFP